MIIAEAAERAQLLTHRRAALEAEATASPHPPPFRPALAGTSVAVIAEIKRASPSKGAINSAIAPAARAREYVAGGAAAISVLTEPRHFGGSPDDLRAVREAVPVPVLRKDFVVDPLQVIEARALGASAVLLIARALPPAHLVALAREARDLGIEPLVEVRSEDELAAALDAGAAAIGVNSRDLETLAVDTSVADRLLPLVPGHCVAIAESGVTRAADVQRVARAGADAVLVGTIVSAAKDAAGAVRALTGVPRRERDGR